MHMLDPTCSLFGEVGITEEVLECHHNFALFNIYDVPVYKAIPLIDIQVDWASSLLSSLHRGHK